MRILKGLRNEHIVRLVGSYGDQAVFALLMEPAAECNLNTYLDLAEAEEKDQATHRANLQTFFGCLASGLKYLHDMKVRHKDIKPANILVDKGKVLLADFGLSFHYQDEHETTTSGPTPQTYKYSAPEVASSRQRNWSADFWSLGCVFIEMLTVLHYRSRADLDKFMREPRWAYHAKLPESIAWLENILVEFTPMECCFYWTEQMLQYHRTDRN